MTEYYIKYSSVNKYLKQSNSTDDVYWYIKIMIEVPSTYLPLIYVNYWIQKSTTSILTVE